MKRFTLWLGFLLLGVQSWAQEDRISLDSVRFVRSYSIGVTFYDGQELPFPTGRAYVEKMFPQLRDLEFKKSGGDIVVDLEIGEPMLLTDVRFDPYFRDEILHYFSLEPPPVREPNSYQYFQPIVLRVNKGPITTLFTVGTIGRLFTRGLLLYSNASASSNDDQLPLGAGPRSTAYKAFFPERNTERRNVLDNLRFVQLHLNDLLDARYVRE